MCSFYNLDFKIQQVSQNKCTVIQTNWMKLTWDDLRTKIMNTMQVKLRKN